MSSVFSAISLEEAEFTETLINIYQRAPVSHPIVSSVWSTQFFSTICLLYVTLLAFLST